LKNDQLKTPVLFLVFNRPDITRLVFEKIRQAKPKQLFIAADGPRSDCKDDIENCSQVRDIFSEIDWPCESKMLLREKNLGCKIGVSSAISWFFKNAEEGIILEDDCLPSQSFFWFCQELLQRYRHNKDIMHISGFNHFSQTLVNEAGYHFTKYTSVWGWATWKSAWEFYTVELKSFPDVKKTNVIKNMFTIRSEQKFRIKIFEKIYNNLINTWDYQWNYAIRLNNGICIRPNVSLIQNVGFSKNATHTNKKNFQLESVKAFNIDYPLAQSEPISINEEIDRKFYFTFIKPSLFTKLKNKLKNLLIK